MTGQQYEKQLTANDTGETGGHQGGIHIPKSQKDLLGFLPHLDPAIKNPDAWLEMRDDVGNTWSFRYVYYNNSLHDEGGTRDEYRITHMTGFFRAAGALPGDIVVLSGNPGGRKLTISVRKPTQPDAAGGEPIRVRLRGWQRVH
jgi:hypothetical protein